MRIKFLTGISSGVWGAFGPGEVGEVPDGEAKLQIAAGNAEPAERETTYETADKKIPRKAEKR